MSSLARSPTATSTSPSTISTRSSKATCATCAVPWEAADRTRWPAHRPPPFFFFFFFFFPPPPFDGLEVRAAEHTVLRRQGGGGRRGGSRGACADVHTVPLCWTHTRLPSWRRDRRGHAWRDIARSTCPSRTPRARRPDWLGVVALEAPWAAFLISTTPPSATTAPRCLHRTTVDGQEPITRETDGHLRGLRASTTQRRAPCAAARGWRFTAVLADPREWAGPLARFGRRPFSGPRARPARRPGERQAGDDRRAVLCVKRRLRRVRGRGRMR